MNDGAPLAWRPRELRAAGLGIAAFEAGARASDAPSVVLLHGLGHWSEAAWGRLVSRLDPACRYIAIDLPGFGASDKPVAAYDLTFFRAVLDDVVAACCPRRFALVGHSLGGFLAADLAGRQPDRVERLALIAPAGFARTPRFLAYAVASGAARVLFTRAPSRRFVRRTLERSVVDPNVLDPAEIERAFELSQDVALRSAFAKVYAGALRTFVDARALHAQFGRYAGPVLCAWGRHDRYIPVAALRAVRRVYPEVQTVILERSAHQPMIEEPAVLAGALRAFLAA